MADINMTKPFVLPNLSEKEHLAMNQLMADKKYRIKQTGVFFRADKSDTVSPEFVLYTLNDYLGHLQNCVASTKRMLPVYDSNDSFYTDLQEMDPVASELMMIIRSINLKELSSHLLESQKIAHNITVSHLIPFTRLLFQDLLRVYYLGIGGITLKYKIVYDAIIARYVPANPNNLKSNVDSAITEWRYIFDTVYVGLYPLVLRMCSSEVLTMHQMFYTKGSRLLSWTGLSPKDILIINKTADNGLKKKQEKKLKDTSGLTPEGQYPPKEICSGLEFLNIFFPEAGWDHIQDLPDMCAYFQPILEFQDAFTQLAPDNPLHQTMILFWILEDLFQGLRHIQFTPFNEQLAELEDINIILDDWILYQESIFDKIFSPDLKSFTHQMYTQPRFYKSPYGQKLLSNMYTLTRTVFLPWFDTHLYGSTKILKDDRLPPFYVRVRRLKNLLLQYDTAIKRSSSDSNKKNDMSIPEIGNLYAPYRFDVPSMISRRLDLICGGKHSHTRTNAVLLEYTLSIVIVLDWWINDKNSFAYKTSPEFLYRVIETGSSIPAFGVSPRTDIDDILFKNPPVRNDISNKK